MLGAQVSWTLVGLSLSLSRPALAQLTFAPKVGNQPGDFNIDNSGSQCFYSWGPNVAVARAPVIFRGVQKREIRGLQ